MALTSKLTAIADAIRAKNGSSGAMTLDQMASAISALPTGGKPAIVGCHPNVYEATVNRMDMGANDYLLTLGDIKTTFDNTPGYSLGTYALLYATVTIDMAGKLPLEAGMRVYVMADPWAGSIYSYYDENYGYVKALPIFVNSYNPGDGLGLYKAQTADGEDVIAFAMDKTAQDFGTKSGMACLQTGSNRMDGLIAERNRLVSSYANGIDGYVFSVTEGANNAKVGIMRTTADHVAIAELSVPMGTLQRAAIKVGSHVCWLFNPWDVHIIDVIS